MDLVLVLANAESMPTHTHSDWIGEKNAQSEREREEKETCESVCVKSLQRHSPKEERDSALASRAEHPRHHPLPIANI